MPRAQDFSQSVVYHIRNKETKEVVYVGSTTNFQQRKAKHKYACNHPNDTKQLKCYVCIRGNGGWDCYEVIPVEFLKLENKTQLLIAEQAEIDKQSNLKNQIRAHITAEEYREQQREYRETHKEQKKEYYETHKEKLLTQKKEYREIHKDKIKEQKKEYRETNKDKIKEYYETHKEKLLTQQKEYREINKEEISARKKEPIECPICKSKIIRHGIARHQRSEKCKSQIKLI